MEERFVKKWHNNLWPGSACGCDVAVVSIIQLAAASEMVPENRVSSQSESATVKLGIENFNPRSYIMAGSIHGLRRVVGFNRSRGGGG